MVDPVKEIFRTIIICLTPIAAFAAIGGPLPHRALYEETPQTLSDTLSGKQGTPLLSMKPSVKADIQQVFSLTIKKSSLPKKTKMLRGYVETTCVGEIINNLYHVVKWNKVKDIELRKSIWRLYNSKVKIQIKIKGFILKKIKSDEKNFIAYYTYGKVDLKKTYDEDVILTVLGLVNLI